VFLFEKEKFQSERGRVTGEQNIEEEREGKHVLKTRVAPARKNIELNQKQGPQIEKERGTLSHFLKRKLSVLGGVRDRAGFPTREELVLRGEGLHLLLLVKKSSDKKRGGFL